MSADIIQLRDYQNPRDLARMYGETLEQQAVSILHSLTPHDTAIYESSLGFIAPESDPA